MSKKSTHKLLLVVLLLVGLALSGCTGAGTGTPTGSFAELTIVVDGEGTVSPKEGPGKYGKGTLVSLTAEPAEGWEFAYWSGDVAQYDSPSTEVVVDDDKVITAVFYN